MADLFSQLGIDWRLLIAQAVNFLIVLAVLYVVLYKPLIEVIRKRTMRISEGLTNADKAEASLAEADAYKDLRIREAEEVAVVMMKERDAESDALKAQKVIETQSYIDALTSRAKDRIKRDHGEAMQAFDAEAMDIVKAAVVKFAGLNPSAVDEQLVREAVTIVRKERATL
jgi:F-type H+-transporting ATPase subunit b